jgi:hypothetical protein
MAFCFMADAANSQDVVALGAKRIDGAIGKRLQEKKIPASPMADDAEFLRRVTLDLTGQIPSYERTTTFLADRDPRRRAKLIDELLESPEFGKHFAVIWSQLLNRLWFVLFGRGIVNPVDDMHADNEPTHPELLQALADDFKTSGFNLKHFVRCVCNSEAYQRTSRPVKGNEDDRDFFSHMAVKVMGPEVRHGPSGGSRVGFRRRCRTRTDNRPHRFARIDRRGSPGQRHRLHGDHLHDPRHRPEQEQPRRSAPGSRR